jgi:hypothetical protein
MSNQGKNLYHVLLTSTADMVLLPVHLKTFPLTTLHGLEFGGNPKVAVSLPDGGGGTYAPSLAPSSEELYSMGWICTYTVCLVRPPEQV